jgi:thimet oligopeptidase
MHIKVVVPIVFSIVVLAVIFFGIKKKEDASMLFRSYKPSEITTLFPSTVSEIESRTLRALQDAQQKIDAIIAILHDQRTYKNTVKAFDEVCSLSNLAIDACVIQVLEMVSPNKQIRDVAHAHSIKIQEFLVDHITNNVALFHALKTYVQLNAGKEQLTPEEQYYLDKTIDDFKRSGLDLPEAQLQEVKNLRKELAALEMEFDRNIAQDNRTITVPKEALQGLEEDFISHLKKTDDGQYILGVDYPTYFTVIENCSVEKTRKNIMHMFENRAYPINQAILKNIIAKRDQLAKKIGFASYADMDLSDQMVQTPGRARQFIENLLVKAHDKERQEFDQLIASLPEGMKLSVDRKINPWDFPYAKNQYKKKHFDIDEQKIAEYFPMEKTVAGLLDIYQKFFSVQFKSVPVSGLWHEDVTMMEVHNAKNDKLLGYFLLDLYPRDNKYSHACQVTILPATYLDGKAVPAIALVIANFPKSTATKPSLLKRNDVCTFFHEFGHALHTLFGRTKIASLSGTSVKRDFVEMPSQMLEEWLSDADMLKKISSHYKTGQPLPDDLIKRILTLKNFSSGGFVSRQLMLSLLSLDIFSDGADKDVHTLYKSLYERCKKYVAYNPDDHMYVSFGHLTGYGAKYYGYMWSKVFALDLFDEIKKHGLLNPEIGKKYEREILSKGGSEDPNILLKRFLGREPNQEAFLKDLGL